MISKSEAQDYLNAVIEQRNFHANDAAQARAALLKLQRESAAKIADLETKLAEAVKPAAE